MKKLLMVAVLVAGVMVSSSAEAFQSVFVHYDNGLKQWINPGQIKTFCENFGNTIDLIHYCRRNGAVTRQDHYNCIKKKYPTARSFDEGMDLIDAVNSITNQDEIYIYCINNVGYEKLIY